jgi:hypothetical protein
LVFCEVFGVLLVECKFVVEFLKDKFVGEVFIYKFWYCIVGSLFSYFSFFFDLIFSYFVGIFVCILVLVVVIVGFVIFFGIIGVFGSLVL